MAYFDTNLIARRGYGGRPMSGMGGFLDDLISGAKSAAGSALDFYGKTEQQAGANAALSAQNTQLTAALAAQQNAGGISTTTLMLIGGVGLAAVLLLRKK
jgi:hypothetical protein